MTTGQEMQAFREAMYSPSSFRKTIPAWTRLIVKRNGPYDDDVHESMSQTIVEAVLGRVCDVVNDHGESPIESLFLQTLGVMALERYGPGFLWFDGPVADIEIHVEEERSGVVAFKEFLEEIESEGNPLTIIEGLGIPQDEIAVLRRQLIRHDLRQHEGYCLNIQAWLPESLSIDGRRMRCDMIAWTYSTNGPRIVIECDGFAYHKGRESFILDRKRDRVLKANGYDVLRFSGPEIHLNPIAAAEELLAYLDAALTKGDHPNG